jgi:hypothetical protein
VSVLKPETPSQTQLAVLAELIRSKNAIDNQIAALVNRPALPGHVGEFIAARIFGIRLYSSATHAHSDGEFIDGALAGRTVNVKWYLKREGGVDLTPDCDCDFHLVMTGPQSWAIRTEGATRPWIITSVHLFDTQQLIADQRARGVQVGVASSAREAQWHAAEIYPQPRNPLLVLTPQQREWLRWFGQK